MKKQPMCPTINIATSIPGWKFHVLPVEPKRVLFLVLASVLVMLHGTAIASQVGMLTFSSFTCESPGLGESGPVSVFGTQNKDGILSLEITAFGRTFSLGMSELRSLSGFTANGIQLFYERGYDMVGGRTLYLVFTGFTGEGHKQALIVLNEDGEIEIEIKKYKKSLISPWPENLFTQ